MKKLVLLGALALAPILAQAQYSNYPNVIPFPGVPSGACAQSQLAVNTANGNLYSCSSASWTAVGTSLPALSDNLTNVISTEAILTTPGTQALPGYGFTGSANANASGMSFSTNGLTFSTTNGTTGWATIAVNNGGIQVGTSEPIGWSSSSTPFGNVNSTALTQDSAGFLALKGASNAVAGFRIYGGNGAFIEYGTSTELLTLSTVGTTTDTTGNLLPANSIIDAVDGRVTTTITTATSWQLGDATTPGRFSAVNAVMTSGSTQVGDVQADQTGAAGPRQVAAAKVRVTTVGTPGAGVIRITVHYHSFTPPTS